jgi:F-type H+-transporting ATPase subunit delta
MSGSKAAIRYAKAVLDLAKEKGSEKAVLGDMETVVSTIAASKELRLMLQSPIVKDEVKKKALLEIFASSSTITKELIRVLVTNERTQALGQVASSYISLYNKERGIQVAQVTTAVPLNDTLETEVLAKVKELTGSNSVTIESIIDPEIIGGFVLRVGDLQYNASIANQLGSIRRQFSKSV